MIQHPQWAFGLELWLNTFDKKDLQLNCYADIKTTWRQASGWNTDRISGKRLKNEEDGYGVIFDMYIFDIHKNDCRLIAKISNNTIYIRGVHSHADYDKWCKHSVHQGKLKR